MFSYTIYPKKYEIISNIRDFDEGIRNIIDTKSIKV